MAAEQLSLSVVGPYLENRVGEFEGLRKAEKFAGGQSNPTFLLSADSGRYVLRKQPPGRLLKSAHAVDREYRVIKALADTEVPVARAYHLCTDRDLIGGMFYLMSYEDGRIFWDPALPDCEPRQRSEIYDEMNRILAALHEVDIDSVGLADYGRPGNYFQRQISRWSSQYQASETERIVAMDRLIEWLPENLPQDDGQASLVHGDYRLDNIVFHPLKGHALAVLDWELSTLGHPYADLAYQCMQLRMGRNDAVAGLGGIDRAELGIPTEQQYVDAYCRRRGLERIPHWEFYIVFSFFRLAAILQGVLKRALDGNASSDKAMVYGTLAPKLAAEAIKEIEQS